MKLEESFAGEFGTLRSQDLGASLLRASAAAPGLRGSAGPAGLEQLEQDFLLDALRTSSGAAGAADAERARPAEDADGVVAEPSDAGADDGADDDSALFGSPLRPEKEARSKAPASKVEDDAHDLHGLAQKKLDADLGSTLRSEASESHIDLMFDPILKCYFDPATNKYYELA